MAEKKLMTCSEFKTMIYVVNGPGGSRRLTRQMDSHARRCRLCEALWVGVMKIRMGRLLRENMALEREERELRREMARLLSERRSSKKRS